MNNQIALVHGSNELPQYPEHLLGERLEAHFFVSFHYRRWLTSDTRLRASEEVRSHILDLFFIAQDQRPVGTLPTDGFILSRLLGITLERWQDLNAREVTPLHKWYRCQCGNEVRLAHPVVLEIVERAVKSRRDRDGELSRRRASKRLKDLHERLEGWPNCRHVAQSRQMVELIDEWLVDNCTGNRTQSVIMEAIEAVSERF